MGLTVLKLKGPQSGDPRSYPYRPGLASTLYSSRCAIFSLRSLIAGYICWPGLEQYSIAAVQGTKFRKFAVQKRSQARAPRSLRME